MILLVAPLRLLVQSNSRSMRPPAALSRPCRLQLWMRGYTSRMSTAPKVRPNVTLSGGLRLETQNAIHDHDDWAPRLSFAWGIGGGGKSAPKTVLRGGFGLFYDRFSNSYVLNADRLNGRTQHQYAVSTQCSTPLMSGHRFLPECAGRRSVASADDFPDLPDRSRFVHASYIHDNPAFTVERQVTQAANVAVTYLNSRGVHQVSFNRHQCAASCTLLIFSGPRPNPNAGDIYQYSLRWNFPAEPDDREFQHPCRDETISVWLLLPELRQQRRFRRRELSLEPVRFESGLRASIICDSGPGVRRRDNRDSARVSPESIYGLQFRFAL